ncbi:hypothetical protein GCE86_08905 [Micromonospora terminaliae]|uniref:Uncharacterized protein n=1 Tax=Micromonospora terminaliae TaxID=1914461 RepID=A0ABX6E2X5_9ACTN|nr:hypothetical protein GCE86_08905 [Micromonospora terminaliae]
MSARHGLSPDAAWLQPTRPTPRPRHNRPLIRGLGVPTLPGRLAALRRLLLQAPAPIVVAALLPFGVST